MAAEIESTQQSSVFFDKGVFLSTIQSKLVEYETEYRKLKEATTILELALWKNKMNEHIQVGGRRNKKIRLDQSDFREQCRIPYQLWDRDGHSVRLAICFVEVVGVQLDDDTAVKVIVTAQVIAEVRVIEEGAEGYSRLFF